MLEMSVPRDEVSFECRFCATSGPKPTERCHHLPSGSLALPTVGALLPVWVLVLPSTHVSSSAQLPVAERTSLFDDAEFIASHMPGGSGFIFEHGAATHGSATACTTSHAHLHVVPEAFDYRAYADIHLPLSGVWTSVNSESLGDYATTEYLLAGTSEDLQVKVLNVPISQYFRRVIAHSVGEPARWNWRDDLRLANYEQTQDFLSGMSAETSY